MISDVIKRLSYVLFPRRCELCGEVVTLDESRCEDCKGQKRISGELCDICGCEKDACNCGKNPKKPEYKRIVAPFYYEKSIVKAIHRFKLYGYTELATALAGEMADTVSDRYYDIKFDYITYVPMSKKRLRKRGYNQSELLASELSRRLDIPLINSLAKAVETPTQRGQSAKQRRLNLYGSFDLADNSDLTDKTVLLVDDVKTTGSTLNECAVMLKAAGARVYCATAAITKYKKK